MQIIFLLLLGLFYTVVSHAEASHTEATTTENRVESEADQDEDGVPDSKDNCIFVKNREQTDTNRANPEGDACDCSSFADKMADWAALEDSHSLRPVSAEAFNRLKTDPTTLLGDSGQSKVYRSTAIKEYCDLVRLKRMGFTTIFRPSAFEKNRDTRIDALALDKEKTLAKAAGIQIISFPMYLSKAKMEELSAEELKDYKKQLEAAVAEMDSIPGKVLIHCFHGRDRTGLLASMYITSKVGRARAQEVYDSYYLNYPVSDLAYRGSPHKGPGIAFQKFQTQGETK